MKITVLTENTSAREDIAAEHGLSLFIEACGHNILFDMGQTDIFAENAKKLNVDLSRADIAVLSHGHYDHGGGLARFFELNDTAPVYASRLVFGEHYNGAIKYIGLDKRLEGSTRFVFTDRVTRLAEGITLYPAESVHKIYPELPNELSKKQGEALVSDDFMHEQYLLIEENGKRVLISGCSHRGVLNIAAAFKPDILVGGFHFSKLALDKTLENYARTLGTVQTEFYTCHCTGTAQFEFVSLHAKNVKYLSAGMTAEL